MASTYSDLKFELIGTGEQSGTWGTTTNTNLGTAIEEAITGSADVTFASAEVTLTLTDTNATQTARNLRLNLTGTSGGAQNLIVPTIEKFYIVNNGCADAITVKNSTGTGIAVPAGKAMLLFNDATNVVDAVTHMSSLSLTSALAVSSGGTGSTTASGARTNLGSTVIGDALFTAATATAAQQAMDVEPGVDVQAYDADLTAIGALSKTDGNFIVGNGSTWVAESGATARTSLGLGDMADQDGSSVTITGGSITGITDLAVDDGGTGASSFTANSVLLGNGTSTFQTVAAGASGNVLTSNGTTWTSEAAGGGSIVTELFTSSGTWTNPGSVTQARVTIIGGGGGGGTYRQGDFGWNGGHGGTAIGLISGLSGPVSVTVGSGGNGGNGAYNGGQAGTAGGTTSFGTFMTATGGAGGPNGAGGNQNLNRATPGTGSVSSGTALKTGYAPTSNLGTVLAGSERGTLPNPTPGGPSTANAYSVSGDYEAGFGGKGGVPSSPNSTRGSGGTSGAVVVEYVG